MAIDFKGINGPNQNQGSVSQSRGSDSASRGQAAARQGAEGSNPSSDDTVELSPAVQVLQQLEASIRDLPEVNEQRVEEIRTAIAEGRFEINAERIAAKLVNLERSLGS